MRFVGSFFKIYDKSFFHFLIAKKTLKTLVKCPDSRKPFCFGGKYAIIKQTLKVIILFHSFKEQEINKG